MWKISLDQLQFFILILKKKKKKRILNIVIYMENDELVEVDFRFFEF